MTQLTDTNLTIRSRPAHWQYEPRNWITLRQPRHDLDDQPAERLLSLAVTEQRGNFRYVRGEQVIGQVEIHADATPGNRDTAVARLIEQLTRIPDDLPPPDADQVESRLAELGCEWRRHDDGDWVVPAGVGRPAALRIRRVPGAARVESTLVSLEDVGPGERAAVAEYLCRSQAGLRYARCELEEHSANVVSYAAGEWLDEDLAESLAAVAHASRRLIRTARALVSPRLAEQYLHSLNQNQPFTDR